MVHEEGNRGVVSDLQDGDDGAVELQSKHSEDDIAAARWVTGQRHDHSLDQKDIDEVEERVSDRLLQSQKVDSSEILDRVREGGVPSAQGHGRERQQELAIEEYDKPAGLVLKDDAFVRVEQRCMILI